MVAGNEQETSRMGGNTQIDERTLRELYLLLFEIAIEQGHPGSVMCSYNRLNGNYACGNTRLLSEVLKHDWHSNGEVQSDWGATHSTSKAINAGLDEEEGSDAGPAYFARVPVLYALANHDISEAAIDDMIRRKLYAMILTGAIDESPKSTGQIDFAAANTFAQDAEERSIVLLQNEGKQILPPSSRLTALSISPFE